VENEEPLANIECIFQYFPRIVIADFVTDNESD
jgi:hypothetical protein